MCTPVCCGGGAWGQVEILATGSRVRMAVNGVALLDYTDPNPELISAGPCARQARPSVC